MSDGLYTPSSIHADYLKDGGGLGQKPCLIEGDFFFFFSQRWLEVEIVLVQKDSALVYVRKKRVICVRRKKNVL